MRRRALYYGQLNTISAWRGRLVDTVISSYVVPFLSLTVKSTTETFTVGTLKAIPVSLPFNDGITRPTAFAAPVELGMILSPPALPSLQSLAFGPSTDA